MRTGLSRSASALAMTVVFAAALGISSAALACGCGGGGGHGGGGGGGGSGGGGSGGGGSGGSGGGGSGGGGAGGGAGAGGSGGSGGGGADAGGGGGNGGDSHAELSGPNFSGTLEAFYSPRRNPVAVQAAYIQTYGRRAPTGGKFDSLFAGGGADVAQDGNPTAAATAVATRRYPEAGTLSAALSPSYGRRALTGGKFDAQIAAARAAEPATAPGTVMAENPPRAEFALQGPLRPDAAIPAQ
jgi:hypothetical protein